jgi:hypothetical protein
MCWSAGSAAAQTAAQTGAPSSTTPPVAQRPTAAASGAPRADPSSTRPAAGPSQDVDRVRAALLRKPTMNLDANRLRFYVEIATKRPTFSEFAKDYDFVNGAAKGGDPMTHQEFLDLVTPKELRHTGGLVLGW